jgi:hypothetical protein
MYTYRRFCHFLQSKLTDPRLEGRHCVYYSEVLSLLALLVQILTPEARRAALERCVLLYWYKSTCFTWYKSTNKD